MTTYLTVAAVRIQTWLLRTPELSLLRGASSALQKATGAHTVGAWLSQRHAATNVADEAGDVDGVVVLEVDDGESAADLAATLCRHLSHELSGLDWEAWWCDAPSYDDARAIYARSSPEVSHLRWPAGLSDVPIVRACECRREPSTPLDDDARRTVERKISASATDDPDGLRAHLLARARLGADCRARDMSQEPDRKSNLAPGSTGTWADIEGGWPTDFDDLARNGGLTEGPRAPKVLGRPGIRNHLATIVADGNAMGDLFSALSLASGSKRHSGRADISARIHTACRDAVVKAAQAVTEPGSKVKVAIPHYLGGDDIFVSVPAALGWRFAQALAATFSEAMAVLADTLPDLDRQVAEQLRTTSLGVGICFAHASHPVIEAHAAAEEALSAAKAVTRRRSGGPRPVSDIGWVDLTSGALHPVGRTSDATTKVGVVGTDILTAEETTPPDVFTLSPSARSQLSAILRDTHRDTLAVVVRRWGTRVGWTRTSELVDLPALLSRARWAPTAATEDPT